MTDAGHAAVQSSDGIGYFRARTSERDEASFLPTYSAEANRYTEKSRRMNFPSSELVAAALVAVAALGCGGTRSQIVERNTSLTLAPTCADAVRVFPSTDKVPYDYYEVAFISAEGNSVYSGNGDLLKSVRNQAAGIGANGVVVDSLGATHATVKILGAALGAHDADRKARALAIWMPSDTARVREACTGK